jgi:hypothetical protein
MQLKRPNLHRVNTSCVTKVVEKQQILIVKNFQVQSWCVMDNHRSKAAKIRGFYLAHNTLRGLNELMYSLPTVNVIVHISNSYLTSTSSEPTKTVQRYSNLTTV